MSMVTREMAPNGNSHNLSSNEASSPAKPVDDDRLVIDNQDAQRPVHHGDESRSYTGHPSSFSVPKQGTGSDRGANGLADFYSHEV